MAGGEEEIAVGENPDVVAVGGAVEIPHDFALVGDDEDLALGVVGANEGMCDWAGGGNCGRIRGSGLQVKKSWLAEPGRRRELMLCS